MRKNLLSFSVFLLLLALLATGLFAYRQAHQLNREATANYTCITANWITAEEESGRSWPEIGKEMMTAYDKLMDLPIRISVIAADGKVVYDSSSDKDELGNHKYRPEVSKVLKDGGTAEAVRYSETLGQDLFYHARSLDGGKYVLRVALPLASEEKVLRNIRLTLFLVALVSALLFFLFYSLYLKRLTKPLSDLTSSVSRLEQGDYSTRVAHPFATAPEIKQLAYAYNRMAEKVETQHTELASSRLFLDTLINSIQEPLLVCNRLGQVLFINQRAQSVFNRHIDPQKQRYPIALLLHDDMLTREVTEKLQESLLENQPARIQATLDTAEGTRDYLVFLSPNPPTQVVLLFHDRTEAAKAERFRSEFVANVTHELRTPLTSIRGFLDTLQNRPDLPTEKQQHFLNIMSGESERLERLITDLLSLSAIETESKAQNRSDSQIKKSKAWSLAELTEEILSQAELSHPEEKLELTYTAEPDLLVQVNRDRIKQLVLNLVENAIKYGDKETKQVRIDWTSAPLLSGLGSKASGEDADEANAAPRQLRRVILRITDNGRGIAVEDQSRIFERFYRADKSRSQEIKGTGLGLAIVKHIAMLYEGQVEVTSELGQGSCFTVSLLLPSREATSPSRSSKFTPRSK